MNYRMLFALAAGWGIVSLGLAEPMLRAAQPQPPAEPQPAAAPQRLAEPAAAIVPQGEPQQISDWALAGIVWSDAHLVRRLALEASEHPDADAHAAQLRSVAARSAQLINSLESFGWKRIAQAEASANVAAAPPAPSQPVTPDLRPALGAAPATPAAPAPVPAAPLPADRDPRLAATLDTETPPATDDPGIDDEIGPVEEPIDIERYRVDDYIDETPAERLNLADAIEDGVEGALAAGIDNISEPPRLFDQDADIVPLPDYDDLAIGRRQDLDPDLDPDIEGEDQLAAAITAPPGPPPVRSLPIERYTDRSEQFAQDAPWVQFRVDANQQRWRMLEAQAETMPLARIVEQLRAAVIQLRADAAVARRASAGSELASLLQQFGGP